MNNIPDEKHIENLGNNQSFLAFLRMVHTRRELEIKSLRNANKDDVLKVSGRIDALDEVMELGQFEKVAARFAALDR